MWPVLWPVKTVLTVLPFMLDEIRPHTIQWKKLYFVEDFEIFTFYCVDKCITNAATVSKLLEPPLHRTGSHDFTHLPQCGHLRDRRDSRKTLGLSIVQCFFNSQIKSSKQTLVWGTWKSLGAAGIFKLCHGTSKFHLLMEARSRTSLRCSTATARSSVVPMSAFFARPVLLSRGGILHSDPPCF